MLEIQLKTRLPEGCTISTLKGIMERCIVKVEGFAKKEDSLMGLLRVKGDVSSFLSTLPSHCDAFALSSKEAKVLIKEHTCLVAIPILESGCVITGVEIKKSELLWSVVCDEESFAELLDRLEGVEYEIIYKGRPHGGEEITYREEEILRIALEKGYFDFPKRIKLEQLAESLGIAPSTLSEILRRGQKKVLEKYFGKV